jgi:hypothetical protein
MSTYILRTLAQKVRPVHDDNVTGTKVSLFIQMHAPNCLKLNFQQASAFLEVGENIFAFRMH